MNIKQFAESHNVKYENVSMFISRHKKMFEGHISTVGKFRYLDDKAIEILLTIIFLPLFCLLKVFNFVEWIIGKIRKKPKPMTREGKLFNLMINHFGCSSVEITYVESNRD